MSMQCRTGRNVSSHIFACMLISLGTLPTVSLAFVKQVNDCLPTNPL